MKNLHFIVDPLTSRCLCGIQVDGAHSCQDIIDAMKVIDESAELNCTDTVRRAVTLVTTVMATLVEDRP